MSITGIDSCISGATENIMFYKTYSGTLIYGHHSSWNMNGIPGAAPISTAGLTGESLYTNSGGLIPDYTVPFLEQPGLTTYLGNLTNCSAVMTAQNHCGLIMCDRLWQNSGIVVTTITAQTINSVTWPPRDLNGSTDGVGVHIGLEVYTPTTNGSNISNAFITYTNSDGVPSRTAYFRFNPATALPANMNQSFFCLATLHRGDKGVRSIQSITLGTSLVSGSISLVALRIIDIAAGPAAIYAHNQPPNCLSSGPRIKLHSGTVPFFLSDPATASATATILGQLHYINA